MRNKELFSIAESGTRYQDFSHGNEIYPDGQFLIPNSSLLIAKIPAILFSEKFYRTTNGIIL